MCFDTSGASSPPPPRLLFDCCVPAFLEFWEFPDVVEAELLKDSKTTDVVGEGYNGGSPRCERVEVLPLHALRGSEDDKSLEDLEAADVVEEGLGGGSARRERV